MEKKALILSLLSLFSIATSVTCFGRVDHDRANRQQANHQPNNDLSVLAIGCTFCAAMAGGLYLIAPKINSQEEKPSDNEENNQKIDAKELSTTAFALCMTVVACIYDDEVKNGH